MTYNLIKYDWSIQAGSASSEIPGKAYITKEDSIFNDFVLYFLYTPDGKFISAYWSESEARLAAAAQGMDCEEKVRQAEMSMPKPFDFETMKGIIL